MFQKAFNDLWRAIGLYPVWLHQAYHEVAAKYKRTILGSIWITGSIVATSLALATVMGGLFGQSIKESLPYIMAGIMSFALGSVILNEGVEIFMSSAGKIKSHAYPFMYYVFEQLTRVYITFLHNVVAYFLLTAILGVFVIPNWTLLITLPIVFVTAAFWASLTAMLAARFRDMRYTLPFFATIIYFISPVFWRPEQLTGWRSLFYKANPMYGMMEMVRSPLMGNMPSFLAWQLTLSLLAAGVCLWVVFFSLNRRKIAFWV